MNKKNKYADFDRIMELHGFSQGTASYRNMLDNIHLKCYVEAATTHQGGTVDKIIRSRDGLPVCLRVRCGVGGRDRDYISVDRVSMWEPYHYYIPNDEYETSDAEMIEYLQSRGYRWDEERSAYVNDAGDEVVW